MNAINFKNVNLDRTHGLLVKTNEVLKYDLTEMSQISNLDSYIKNKLDACIEQFHCKIREDSYFICCVCN